MSKILIVYASDYGNTEKMANAIAEGAKKVPDTEVTVKKAEDVTADDLTANDGYIIGTPVHMGSIDWRVKKFIDTVCSGMWMKDALVGKVGGVFATGSGYGGAGGGCELTLLALLNNMAELGLILVPLPKKTPGYTVGGLHWGPYARSAGVNMEQTGVADESLEAARYHGVHVARVTAALKDTVIFK
jgi:NAD(P)H dehydrogenase (quinone)